MASKGGYSLLELVGVLAVLGVLLSFAIPAISGSQRAAKVEHTRAQFARLSLAVEAYRGYYGRYPALAETADVSLAGQEALLLESLLGYGLDGGEMAAAARALNPQARNFLQLAADDLEEDGRWTDAFGNHRWHYVWDHDRDGWIELAELTNVPEASRPVRPLPTGVYWYVEGGAEGPWIVSW
ncbi:MAG: type II secretion system protein [Verrucomicrobiota bacterium JB022]|nr:type II secretion system protein [Verrucomicrobiota bacterium JB022]